MTIIIATILMISAIGFMYLRIKTRLKLLRRDIVRHAKKNREELGVNYRQIEATIALNTSLRPRYPLPQMRIWAVSADFANIVIKTIAIEKPKVIVECGCGVSSLVAGYCLEKIGDGHLYSLEHFFDYGKEVGRDIEMHGLKKWITIIDANLIPVKIEENTYQWYDCAELFSILDNMGKIDLLIVDGPPGRLSPMARYPALPLLWERLSDRAVVLMDDYNRQDEKKIVDVWRDRFKFGGLVEQPTEKGTCILYRKARN